MFGRIANMFGGFGGAPTASGLPPGFAPPTQGQIQSLLGPSPRLDPTQDHIQSQVFSPPYQGPNDLDPYSGEAPEVRADYMIQYLTSPVLRAAIRGKADDICCLEPTMMPADKDDELSAMAAKFVDWTVRLSPGGWPGLIDTVYTPGSLLGFSVSEKRLKETEWKGRKVLGLSHVRGLDPAHLKLRLDVYFNVVQIVNQIRGLQYYDPDQVILYSHNSLFHNPFGQSDCRAAIRAATMISNVYKVWYVALKVYGLPYMVGKSNDKAQRKMLGAALQSLREGGYIVLPDPKDTVEVLNLASAAALTGFADMVHIQREDVFFAVRGVAQPFMEGDGGADSHTDTSVQQGTSNAGERRIASMVADTINRQLVPWLVGPNFDLPPDRMPRLKLGGTDWKNIKEIVGIVKDLQEVGKSIGSKWLDEVTGVPSGSDGDELVSAQEKQAAEQQKQQEQAAQQPQPGGANPLAALGGAQPQPPKQLEAAKPAGPKPEPVPKASAFSDAVRLLPTSRLSADPARFQFRHGHDGDDGTVRELPPEKFDPAKCKDLLAWHDPADDEDYVVDGHHRLAWAERDGVKRVPVRFLDAKTAEEAKEMGRRANLSQPKASTFSADHKPDAVPSAAQVARAAEQILAELMA